VYTVATWGTRGLQLYKCDFWQTAIKDRNTLIEQSVNRVVKEAVYGKFMDIENPYCKVKMQTQPS